jgi:hypothetical protein
MASRMLRAERESASASYQDTHRSSPAMLHSILLTATLFAHATSAGETPRCLAYAPDTVRITGKLTRHMFYGAPNFGEDPKHDAREPGFYLDLARPICTLMGVADSGDEAKAKIDRVQLILDQPGYARLRPFLGRTITLRGTLVGAITGHHHAPVLLEVLRPVDPRSTTSPRT